MAKPSKLSAPQIDEIITMRERGWSYQSIARRLSVTPGAIHYQCLKNGAISPHQRRTETPREPRSFIASDGRTQRIFTQAEDAELLRLEELGLTYAALARAMSRPITSCRIRLMTLAMREDLPERAPRVDKRASPTHRR